MKLFRCSHCGQVLYFENTWCGNCGYSAGLYEDKNQLYALSAKNNDSFILVNNGLPVNYRYCANHAHNVCNWLVPANNNTAYCRACELNHVIPNLQLQEYRERWAVIEEAKHRLIYSLIRLQLPFASKLKDRANGLQFDFVSDEKYKKVFTGHQDGLITINIAEADDIEREQARRNMHEPYRTVLGHFRHEIGHYYWDMLVDNTPNLQTFRGMFGDETRDYGQALQQHYNNGPQPNWMNNYISSYAASHPWEDWAETWAHYMHIMDTLETAYSFSIAVNPSWPGTGDMKAAIYNDPYNEPGFEKIITQWLPLTYAMNSLNRSMGIKDIYPFVITPRVMQKLQYVHALCYANRQRRINEYSLVH